MGYEYIDHSLSQEREEKNMDRLLTLNGRSYKAAEFDINLICDFEEYGIPLGNIDSKMFNVIRLYVATSMNTDLKTAGREISEHLRNGGSIEEISNVMSEMMEISGFFRTESKDQKTGNTKRTRTKKTESEEVTSELTENI